MESILTSGSILKVLPTIAGGNFPIFVVMIPQESGIGASGISTKFSIEGNWGCSFWEVIIQGEWSAHEKFNGGDYWSEFEGLTTETELIAAIRLKFLLLWVDLDYWGNLTSQVTEGLKVIFSTQYSAKRTRNMLGGPEEVLYERSPRDWLGGITSLSCCHLIIDRFYLFSCYYIYLLSLVKWLRVFKYRHVSI